MILSVILFDVNGTTAEKHLGTASNINWVDDIDAEGSFSFAIPLEDIGNMQIGSIVKFALGDNSTDYVFGGSVEDIKIEKIGESSGGIARTVQVTGRGLKARLADAVVYPVNNDSARFFTNQSAGAIFKTLFDEAQSRGALTGFSLDFTNTTDSNNEAFTELLTIDVSVGSTLLEVANEHQEIAADYWVEPDLTIKYANSRGTDLTTGANPLVLRAGESVSEIVVSEKGPITNTVLVSYETVDGETYTTRNDSTSVSNFGRREGYLSLATTFEESQVNTAALKALEKTANASNSKTINIDSNGPVPYIDFNVGDIIFLADIDGTRESFRIRSVSVTEDAAGNISFVPELGTTRANLDKRLANALSRIEKGTLDSEFTFDNSDLGDLGDELGASSFIYKARSSYDNIVTKYDMGEVDGGATEIINATGENIELDDIVAVGSIIDDSLGDQYAALGILAKADSFPFHLNSDRREFEIDTPYIIHDWNNYLDLKLNPYAQGQLQTAHGFSDGFALFYSQHDLNALKGGNITTNLGDAYYTTGTDRRMFLTPNGRLINIAFTRESTTTKNIEIAYKNSLDDDWTVWTPSSIGATSNKITYVFDKTNGAFWGFIGDNALDAIQFLDTDTAPVELTSFQASLVGSGGTAEAVHAIADNGLIYLHKGGSTMTNAELYYKNSNDNGSLSSTSLVSNMKEKPRAIDTNGNLYYIYTSGGNSYADKYDSTANTITSNTLSISTQLIDDAEEMIIQPDFNTLCIGTADLVSNIGSNPYNYPTTHYLTIIIEYDLATNNYSSSIPAYRTSNGEQVAELPSSLTVSDVVPINFTQTGIKDFRDNKIFTYCINTSTQTWVDFYVAGLLVTGS